MNGFAALDIPPCRRYVVVKATAGFAVCRLILKLLLFYSCLDFTQNLGKTQEIAATRLSMGQASIPAFSSDDDARTFAKNLKDHGFVNVTTEAVSGHKGKQYEIIEVVVDGAPDYSPDTWYPTDTDIVVRYCAETNQGNTVDQIFDRVNDFLS